MKRIGNIGEQEKPGVPGKPLLLYVEDDPTNQLVARCKLERKYELLLAGSAAEACTVLGRQGPELAVILMDIELKESEMNGIQLAKLIRGRLDRGAVPRYAKDVPVLDIPIIFVTAYGTKYDAEELRSCGARVIDKPVDFVDLETCLTKLKLRKLR